MHIAIWNCSWNHGSILIILINIILLAILIKGKLWNPQLRKRSIPHSMKWVCIISNVEHIHMRCFKVGVDHCIYITTINTMKFESSVNCAKFQIFATTEIQSQNNHSIWCTKSKQYQNSHNRFMFKILFWHGIFCLLILFRRNENFLFSKIFSKTSTNYTNMHLPWRWYLFSLMLSASPKFPSTNSMIISIVYVACCTKLPVHSSFLH